MCGALSVEGTSDERVIRPVTSVLLRGESHCVNKLVLCCVSAVVDGSEPEEGWQYIFAGGRNKYHPARSEVSAEGVMCGVCGRKFRRPGDMKRHKCREERGQSGGRPNWFCVVQTVPEMAQECWGPQYT